MMPYSYRHPRATRKLLLQLLVCPFVQKAARPELVGRCPEDATAITPHPGKALAKPWMRQ
jgi:hypothetical protein